MTRREPIDTGTDTRDARPEAQGAEESTDGGRSLVQDRMRGADGEPTRGHGDG